MVESNEDRIARQKARNAEFKRELEALLEKHNATIIAEDHWSGYAECGEDVRMTVEFASDDVAGHFEFGPDAEIDLGRNIGGEPK